jgi:hypothetical protein
VRLSSTGGRTGRDRATAAATPYRRHMADVTYRPQPLLRTLLGEVLRRRLEQERTLAEVTRDACVSVQYLTEVERGRKEAGSQIVAAGCNWLGIGLADLSAELGRDPHGASRTSATAGDGPAVPRGTRSGDVVLAA